MIYNIKFTIKVNIQTQIKQQQRINFIIVFNNLT